MKNRFLLVFFMWWGGLYSQNPTISQKSNTEREGAALHKVLIIPFEPRLYMSEIDRNINAETKLSGREIKYKFRDGLNEQVYKAFKAAKYNALDLMEDTLRYKKDLETIYQYLSYEYLKVPDPQNYIAPKKEKEEKKIDKGQVNVETNSENRFMDARLSNPKVLTSLQNKYRCDLFVFVNQLDLKAGGSKDPLDLGPENPNRRIIFHYTVFTAEGKELNSGTIEEEFDPALNIPKKIVDKHFMRISTTLVQRVNKALGIPK
ncbi:MAG: hypothetical protein PSX36_11920 [bacterium]|nr:hypothetical protein [bacterium]